MFDFDISLFIITMWITIISYFISSPDDGGYTEYKVEIQNESSHMKYLARNERATRFVET